LSKQGEARNGIPPALDSAEAGYCQQIENLFGDASLAHHQMIGGCNQRHGRYTGIECRRRRHGWQQLLTQRNPRRIRLYIGASRFKSSGTTVEILTGDFRGDIGCIDRVALAKPDVFNHNLETVPRLYPTVRPGARYFRSLRLLQRVKEVDPSLFTKSGLMVGLGETREEVAQVMDDMRAAGIYFLTVGQYLQPTPKHAPVDRFGTPDEFAQLETMARAKGFLMVSATPLTRSSYHAGDDFLRLKLAREAKLCAAE
jgi:lipoate synthase